MENIHAANHGWLIEEGQVVHGPGDAAHFRVHLNQHFRNDRAQIFATLNRTSQNHLRRDGVLFKQEPLDVIIKLTTLFGSGQDEHDKLHSLVELLLQSALPCIKAHARSD